MLRKNILRFLEGGDRTSIGRADQVAAFISKNPRMFPKLIAGLWSDDPVVRMRAADATEKVTRKNREVLRSYTRALLGLMAETAEAELRWHLAAIVPRLPLKAKDRQLAVSLLRGYLEDGSSIVKTFALQGLADLAQDDSDLQPEVLEMVREAGRSGKPAMKARSRKLLAHLEDA
jgi:hypothetical protein